MIDLLEEESKTDTAATGNAILVTDENGAEVDDTVGSTSVPPLFGRRSCSNCGEPPGELPCCWKACFALKAGRDRKQ